MSDQDARKPIKDASAEALRALDRERARPVVVRMPAQQYEQWRRMLKTKPGANTGTPPECEFCGGTRILFGGESCDACEPMVRRSGT